MKVYAYLRVSRDRQDLENQKTEISEYARKHDLKIDEFIENESTVRRTSGNRRIDELFGVLEKQDMLVVSELSMLGRSIGQIVCIVDELVKNEIRFVAIKEAIEINGKNELPTRVLISLFGLLAEIERGLISDRTRQGLAAARAKGRLLGRPKGSLGKSRLDGKDRFIKEELKYGVAKSAIARKLGVSRTTLVNYIRTRNIEGGG